jgi:hypothetical protein
MKFIQPIFIVFMATAAMAGCASAPEKSESTPLTACVSTGGAQSRAIACGNDEVERPNTPLTKGAERWFESRARASR